MKIKEWLRGKPTWIKILLIIIVLPLIFEAVLEVFGIIGLLAIIIALIYFIYTKISIINPLLLKIKAQKINFVVSIINLVIIFFPYPPCRFFIMFFIGFLFFGIPFIPILIPIISLIKNKTFSNPEINKNNSTFLFILILLNIAMLTFFIIVLIIAFFTGDINMFLQNRCELKM